MDNAETQRTPRVKLNGVTAFDVAVIVPIVVLSLLLIVLPRVSRGIGSTPGAEAVIFQNGLPAGRFALDHDRQLDLLDGRMHLEIKDHRIRVTRSDCKRRLCVHRGWVENKGETIVCVPFKTIIEIQSDGKPIVDAVVF